MKPWLFGFACVLGLAIGSYLLGAALYDLGYTIGPFRPDCCAYGPSVERQVFSLEATGIALILLSLIALSSIIIRRGRFEPSVWIVWFVRLVFVAGTCLGILMFLGSDSLICDPFGPFGSVGTFCGAHFDPYEVIGPLLASVSLIGLAFSFLTQRMIEKSDGRLNRGISGGS